MEIITMQAIHPNSIDFSYICARNTQNTRDANVKRNVLITAGVVSAVASVTFLVLAALTVVSNPLGWALMGATAALAIGFVIASVVTVNSSNKKLIKTLPLPASEQASPEHIQKVIAITTKHIDKLNKNPDLNKDQIIKAKAQLDNLNKTFNNLPTSDPLSSETLTLTDTVKISGVSHSIEGSIEGFGPDGKRLAEFIQNGFKASFEVMSRSGGASIGLKNTLVDLNGQIINDLDPLPDSYARVDVTVTCATTNKVFKVEMIVLGEEDFISPKVYELEPVDYQLHSIDESDEIQGPVRQTSGSSDDSREINSIATTDESSGSDASEPSSPVMTKKIVPAVPKLFTPRKVFDAPNQTKSVA